MKIKVDKAGNPRYFTARLGWGEQFDAREMDVLCSGALPMLIPPAAVQGQKNDAIFFDISPYAPLDFYLTYSFSRQQAGELFLSCVHVLQRVQQGYMNCKNLVLELDKIYVYLEDGSIHLIYLPLMNSTREVRLPEFFYRLVSGMARSSYELSAFLDECGMFLQRPVPFTLEEFEAFVQQRMYQTGAAAAPAQSQYGYQPDAAQQPAQYGYQPEAAQQPAQYGYQPDAAQQQPAQYGYQPDAAQQPAQCGYQPEAAQQPAQYGYQPDAAPVRGAEEQAAAPAGVSVPDGAPLSEGAGHIPAVRFYLLRDQTGERVEIAPSFLVGTELGTVDYCVTGNPAVSRRHALFTIQDGRCCVTDQGSTNSTYVNGFRLTPHTLYGLEGGARLYLANEPFTLIREEI